MTYEEFKQLAEHPQHRDIPSIFKLEVIETEELEEKKRSHYPKYKVSTYCPQAFATTLSFHPNDCRGTVVIKREDFERYLTIVGNTYEYLKL